MKKSVLYLTILFSLFLTAFFVVNFSQPKYEIVSADDIGVTTLCANKTSGTYAEYEYEVFDSLQAGESYFTVNINGSSADFSPACDATAKRQGGKKLSMTESDGNIVIDVILDDPVFADRNALKNATLFFDATGYTLNWQASSVSNKTTFIDIATTKTGYVKVEESYHSLSDCGNEVLNNLYDLKITITPNANVSAHNLIELDITLKDNPPSIRTVCDEGNKDVWLNKLFTDWMILQQRASVEVWGYGGGADGNTVTVSIGNQNKTAVVRDYEWSVTLDPMQAATDLTLTVKGEYNEIVVNNVAVGEVFIAAGQSNMQRTVETLDGGSDDDYIKGFGTHAIENLKENPNKNLRLFKQAHTSSRNPNLKDLDSDGWHYADFDTAYNFSATGYFYGAKIQELLGVPVGIIYAAVGGTRIQSWIPQENMLACTNPLLKEEQEELKMFMSGDSYKDKTYHPNVSSRRISSSNLYYGMVRPLAPYTVNGVLWYQGESNAADVSFYDVMLEMMQEAYRKEFHNENLTFLVVELAPCVTAPGASSKRTNYIIGSVQGELMQKLDNTYTCVVCDIPKEEGNYNIHPQDKVSMGDRLAYLALEYIYGIDENYSSPFMKSVDIDGDYAIVSFMNVGSYLTTDDGSDEIKGFQLKTSSSGNWLDAEAFLYNEDTVIVYSESVNEIFGVRYNYSEAKTGNIVNSAGLPAAIFTTDNLYKSADYERSIQKNNYLETVKFKVAVGSDKVDDIISGIVNGEKTTVKIIWNYDNVDFGKPGEYSITGVTAEGRYLLAKATVEVVESLPSDSGKGNEPLTIALWIGGVIGLISIVVAVFFIIKAKKKAA